MMYNYAILILVLLQTLSKGLSDVIVVQPQDTTVELGAVVLLDCRVQGAIGPVQWLRNGFGLGTDRNLESFPRYEIHGSEDRGEYNLYIANVRLEDDEGFQCQVGATETTPGETSRTAKLTVLVPPDTPVISDSSTVDVVADQPTNISCEAKGGKPAANITWVVDAVPIDDPSQVFYTSENQAEVKKLQDATGIITVTAGKSDHGNRVECRAQNAALNNPRWTSVNLNVLYPPEVVMMEQPAHTLQEHQSINFACDAVGNPSEITWKWLQDGEVLIGNTAQSLKLDDLSREMHGKTISCEATNSVGSTRNSFLLNIHYGARILTAPEPVAVNIGENAVLRCEVDGNPPPTIVWRRRGRETILATTSTLHVPNVQVDELGVYVCTASVINFNEIKMDVHLVLNGPPKILSDSDQSASFGETGKVECAVHAIPKPKAFIWSKDGEQLDFDALERYYVREEKLPSGSRSVIEISSIQSSDFGEYNCTVDNGYGLDTLIIDYSKKDLIPVVYILLGVLAGVIIIILVAVAIFMYYRRKKQSGDSMSEGSEDSITKKKDVEVDSSRGDYRDNVYGSPIDAWQQGAYDKMYRHSAEYDELSYPPKEPAYDYRDSGPYSYNDYRNYGTYPGRPSARYDPTYGTAPYAASDYGTSGGPVNPPPSDYGIYAPHSLPPPVNDYSSHTLPSRSATSPASPAPLNSRLATNV